MSGKHAAAEPMKEALEKHYKDENERLKARIAELEATVDELRLILERKNFKLKLKDVEIESLVKSLEEALHV